MTVYWLMLLVPLIAGISPWKAKGKLPDLQWFLYGVFLILIIGLRHEVGGDWQSYFENYSGLQGISFTEAMTEGSISKDYGFEAIHWVSLNYLNGIYATNLFCAMIFVAGLLRVCKNMPIPWLALVVAIPYLVIVVATGYTRQASAIGFIMWGMIDLMQGRQARFYLMVILGTLFHKTALFMLPVGFLFTNSLTNLKNLFFFILFFFIAFAGFMAEHIARLTYYYVEDTQGMESSGAVIRVTMNVASALVFLYFRKHWAERFSDRGLWTIYSVTSLVMFPLAFVISTTVDRMALYFLPMQLVILSRVPLFIPGVYNRTMFILSVLVLYIGALFVWLNFGQHSSHWLPYQNLLFL
ncbi:MAG: EpsG family protein [Chlorobiaceae bacterium]